MTENISSNDLFNKEKFKQVFHYLIHETGSLENVGKTVLFKIIYFIDFNFYEMFEEKLTGESYRKIRYGPAPVHFNEIIKELKEDKQVREFKKDYNGHAQQKYVSIVEPDISLLNAKELEFINKNTSVYSNFNATQISEYSHQDVPYTATDDKEIIDYELVFYRDPIFSVREYDDSHIWGSIGVYKRIQKII